eukprot:11236515-Alexandrium_andersonii.AAC.1
MGRELLRASWNSSPFCVGEPGTSSSPEPNICKSTSQTLQPSGREQPRRMEQGSGRANLAPLPCLRIYIVIRMRARERARAATPLLSNTAQGLRRRCQGSLMHEL